MNLGRLSVLPKFVKLGDPLLVCNLRNAGKCATPLPHRRTFKSHPRNLAYAKDLFLGQLNKVSGCIYGAIAGKALKAAGLSSVSAVVLAPPANAPCLLATVSPLDCERGQ